MVLIAKSRTKMDMDNREGSIKVVQIIIKYNSVQQSINAFLLLPVLWNRSFGLWKTNLFCNTKIL